MAIFVLLARPKCSKIRSRPRQLIAYSPEGFSASCSREPPRETGESPYTFPVEKTAILLSRKRLATSPGKNELMAQVSHSWPVEPNFIPAMKTTLAASGSLASEARSSKSQRTVSTPQDSNRFSREEDENRE